MSDDIITTLTDAQAIELLKSVHLGRLVVRVGDDIDIFPVNYVVDEANGPSIVFRTAEGSKLVSLTINNKVLFEVDNATEDSAFSVIIRGTATRITDSIAILEADKLDLKPWVPTLKYNYVRISLDSISARSFILGEEPERYTSADNAE